MCYALLHVVQVCARADRLPGYEYTLGPVERKETNMKKRKEKEKKNEMKENKSEREKRGEEQKNIKEGLCVGAGKKRFMPPQHAEALIPEYSGLLYIFRNSRIEK